MAISISEFLQLTDMQISEAAAKKQLKPLTCNCAVKHQAHFLKSHVVGLKQLKIATKGANKNSTVRWEILLKRSKLNEEQKAAIDNGKNDNGMISL